MKMRRDDREVTGIEEIYGLPERCTTVNPGMNTGEPTAAFKSVIGFGKAVLIEESEEKVDAIKVMPDHYNRSGFPVTGCKGLKMVEVYRIVPDRVTGMRNK